MKEKLFLIKIILYMKVNLIINSTLKQEMHQIIQLQ